LKRQIVLPQATSLRFFPFSKMRKTNFPSAFDSYSPPEHKVYGCICISPNNKVLLVKGRKGQIWSFPKGHRERADKNGLACALRELKEETGISLKQDYIAFKKYKAGEYYIFPVSEEFRTFPIDTLEVDSANWFTYEEICDLKKNIDVSLFCQYIQKKILPEEYLECVAPQTPISA
jgi:ADP-ribose pyrophosphatase YjhB (NUDIX family)